jgi:hypothetical protein
MGCVTPCACSSTDHLSEVSLCGAGTQPIASAGDATVGRAVKRGGGTTQVQDGTVTGLNVTVKLLRWQRRLRRAVGRPSSSR